MGGDRLLTRQEAEQLADFLWNYRRIRLENIRKKTQRTKWEWLKAPKTFWIPREVRMLLQEKIDRVRDASRRAYGR